MVTLDQVRQLALSLPESTEQDHHGMISFRVRGKIFATVPDVDHIRIMVAEPQVVAAVAENPATCEEFYWGRRLACVVVELEAARPDLVRELVTEAWIRKAPGRLARELPDPFTGLA